MLEGEYQKLSIVCQHAGKSIKKPLVELPLSNNTEVNNKLIKPKIGKSV